MFSELIYSPITPPLLPHDGMFQKCASLVTLDLSSFDTHNVTDMVQMFSGCTNLKTIYAGTGWSMASVTNSTQMFSGCTNLVGGAGTTYNPYHVNINGNYAHIDGGTSNPGYFTEKAPSGVETISANHLGHSAIYDLGGRRHTSLRPRQKGIYIIEGKKRIVE